MGNFIIIVMLVIALIFYPSIYLFKLLMYGAKIEQKMKEEILELITLEIRIAQREEQRTSRLTSLYNKINEKYV